jgi:hypothetical protein
MRPIELNYTPANANLTGFLSNATGATWTLTNTAATDGLAHQISIKNDSVTDHSGKTALATGTDVDGYALTETITLPGISATVESTKYFKTLTSLVPSSTIGADTMDIGWVDEFITQTIPLNWRGGIIALNTIVGGTISYTVQQTLDNVQQLTDRVFNWVNNDDTSLVNATATKNGNYIGLPCALRVVVNSYSSGATLDLFINQRNS